MLAHAAYAATRRLRGLGRRPMAGMGLRLRRRRWMGMSMRRFWRWALGWLRVSGWWMLLSPLLILRLRGLVGLRRLVGFAGFVRGRDPMLLAL